MGQKGELDKTRALQNHLQRGLIRGPWKPAKGLKLESDMVHRCFGKMALAAVEDALNGGWEDQLGDCCGPDEGLWEPDPGAAGKEKSRI